MTTSNCYFWFDEATGLLVTSYYGQNKINNDLYVGILGAHDKSIAVHYGLKDAGSTWLTRLLEYKDANGVTHTSAIYNTHIYADVTLKTTTGTALTVSQIASASTLVCCTSDDTCLFAYAADDTSFSGSGVVELDSYYGTYTSVDDTVILDGTGKIYYNDKTSTYTKVEGKEYGFDVYLGNNTEYYELTLDGTSFTMVKPMVTVSYDCDGKAEEAAVTVNKNIAYALPVLTNAEYVFRGWYTDNSYATKVDASYVPTKEVTLFAKWDAKYTLTVVYGNTLDNAIIEYGAGDTIAPVQPPYTNNLLFEGWYTDADCTTKLTDYVISGNTIIYCKWQEGNALFGSYAGFEVWGSSTSGSNVSGGSTSYSLKVSADSKVSGKYTGIVYNYDAATGYFRFAKSESDSSWYVGYYFESLGILVYNYNSTSESSANQGLGVDVYVLFKDATKATTGNLYSCYWTKGTVKLLAVTATGFAKDSFLVFIDGNNVYYDVTYTSTDGTVEPQNAYKANQLSVFDSNGTLIKSYTKDSSLGLIED